MPAITRFRPPRRQDAKRHHRLPSVLMNGLQIRGAEVVYRPGSADPTTDHAASEELKSEELKWIGFAAETEGLPKAAGKITKMIREVGI
jgi:hypothetical protein